MRKKHHLYKIFLFGLICGMLTYHCLFAQKKSNGLLLQKNGKQVSLDFSDSAKGTKIQFFDHYYIESTSDSITIHPY